MPDRTVLASGARPGVNGAGSEDDLSLAELLRELAADGRRLVRDEIDLAKLELRRTARGAAVNLSLVGGGLALAGFGAAALVAAVVIGLGILIGSHWASALIVGALLVGAGALGLVLGVRRLRATRLTPEKTLETLREDAAWVGSEAREMRRDWSRA